MDVCRRQPKMWMFAIQAPAKSFHVPYRFRRVIVAGAARRVRPVLHAASRRVKPLFDLAHAMHEREKKLFRVPCAMASLCHARRR